MSFAKCTMVILAAAFLVQPVSASAAVACGDVITEDSVLRKRLVCPGGVDTTALTIANGATLTMVGRARVSCQDPGIPGEEEDFAIGVRLVGEGATLYGGRVTGCGHGVLLAGDGGHQLFFVRADRNYNDNVRTERGSDGNFLYYVTASRSIISDGVELNSDYNVLIRVRGYKNGDDGTDWNETTGNTCENCSMEENLDDGFKIDGGTDNHITNSRALRNEGDGFDIDEGTDNHITNSQALRNEGEGFNIDGDSNTLSHVIADRNGDDGIDLDGMGNSAENCLTRSNDYTGIEMTGTENSVANCWTSKNGWRGVYLDECSNCTARDSIASRNGHSGIANSHGEGETPGEGNLIEGNYAVFNGRNRPECSEAEFSSCTDLFDVVPGCGTNMWQDNTFYSKDPDCIQ